MGGGDTGWGSAVSSMDAHPPSPSAAMTTRRLIVFPLTSLDIVPSPDGNEEG